MSLTEDGEDWLCKNVDKSASVLNRILRYPAKSKIISQWALDK
ncbi:hypothetical protein EZS27_027858 [termite gut metagenome]|uniref:Uncharacterized protein n=1 Tax=termite gut metagenome TaxID=433724 RepID=A0A5J4QNL2_9ZZZZ